MKSLVLSLLISTALLSLSQAERCNPQDKKVLLQIKKSFGDPYVLASWLNNTDCCTDWYIVKCDPTTNRIISFRIFTGKLSGQIPKEVGDLPSLQTLEFHKLNITGPIQPAIAKLKHLTWLELSWLNLTGPVPSFLGKLKNLRFLDLSFNKLSGSIPSELGNLPNLLSLRLDRNNLTGSIPSALGNFNGSSAPSIYLSHNQLSGKIPASFNNLNLTRIELGRNKLEGDASMLFGSNKTVQIMDLDRNMLEFNLSNIVFPNSLTSLDISHNKIYGSIPPQLTQVDFLQFLNVSYNRLCGEIPVGGRLQRFSTYEYFHNKCLCGSPLPACK